MKKSWSEIKENFHIILPDIIIIVFVILMVSIGYLYLHTNNSNKDNITYMKNGDTVNNSKSDIYEDSIFNNNLNIKQK